MSTQALSPLITVSALKQLQENHHKLVIIDARFDLMNEDYGDVAYAKSRIPNALRVDLDIDLCAKITVETGRHPLKSPSELEALMQDLGINSDDRIIIYDDNGGTYATHLWWVLHWLGHQDVQVLEGGFKGWQIAGYALETGEPTTDQTTGNFTIRASDFGTVTTQDVLDDLSASQSTLCIVDARGAARYRGEVEPLDPVAGHIPNAINRPFECNLKDDGTFKSPDVLKDEWNEFLQDHSGKIIVQQCGSGVSACNNIFAMYYAGLGITKLYPGSWSEWCKNPERPIAKG